MRTGNAPQARATISLAATQLLATLVLVASLYSGIGGLSRDLSLAFRHASPRVLPASVVRELDAVKQRVPAGQAVLFVTREDFWYPRLLQRGLYPRNAVVVRQDPGDPLEGLAGTCARYGIRFVIWSGAPPRDLAFAWQRELGGLPGGDGPMILGALAP